jgi:hypothetical protein
MLSNIATDNVPELALAEAVEIRVKFGQPMAYFTFFAPSF